MADDATISINIQATDNVSASLSGIQQQIQTFTSQVTGGMQGLQKAAQDTQGTISSMATDFVVKMGLIVASMATVRAAFEDVKSGIEMSDSINSMTASLGALTGSTKTAAEAMAYFQKAAEDTRATAMELAQFYQTALPLALHAGFDPTILQGFIVGLASRDRYGQERRGR